MQVIVSLIAHIPASADMNQIEEAVQEASPQTMRNAIQQAVRVAEDRMKTCPHFGERGPAY